MSASKLLTESASTAATQALKPAKVLVVDDQKLILDCLVNYITRYHQGETPIDFYGAETPEAALELLQAHPDLDLVVSDVHLRDANGGELLQRIQAEYPHCRRALMSAYYLEDTIATARKYGVYSMMAKMVPFDFEEFARALQFQVQPLSAFGLPVHCPELTELNTFELKNSDAIMEAFFKLQGFFTELELANINDLSTALIEALTNAVYHAYPDPENPETDKYEKGQRIEALAPDETVTLTYGASEEWLGVSILDQGGRLSPEQTLYWMERNFKVENLLDTSGRGLYLIYMLADRMVLNIHPGHKTEVILLARRNRQSLLGRDSNKPLYIHVV